MIVPDEFDPDETEADAEAAVCEHAAFTETFTDAAFTDSHSETLKTMAKKYTRKQLRQPDEFISMSNRVAELAKTHAKLLAMMVAVIIVITGAAWTWSYLQDKQAREATAMLTRAMEIYAAQKASEGDADDGIPRFKTRTKKLEAAEKAFDRIVDEYGDASVGLAARAMRGAVRHARANYQGAVKDYQHFVERAAKEDRFRAVALEGLIYCYEALKQWDKALEYTKQLTAQVKTQPWPASKAAAPVADKTAAEPAKDEDDRLVAVYHEARILLSKGREAEAKKRFKEVVDHAKSQLLQRQAGQRLAAMDSRALKRLPEQENSGQSAAGGAKEDR